MMAGIKNDNKVIEPTTIRTGMLKKMPIIIGIGATKMINIHLKNLIKVG